MTISAARNYSISFLESYGFRSEEAAAITENLIQAELVEKKTHGFVRLPAIANYVKQGKIKVNSEELTIISEFPSSIHFDAKFKPGFYAIYKSLELALAKVKLSGIVSVAIKDMAYASGYIGDYARIATENDYIFIGFNNSPKGLVPYGTTKNLWGTDPVTIGIPTHSAPVILDMASSQCTWGDLLVAKTEGKNIKPGVAVDFDGKITIDPTKAMEGGILSIAGHKGSGLAFIVELLGGALSNSRVGSSVPGGWGSFYLLINPAIFRDMKQFKDDVQTAIAELKSAPRAEGFKEVFFPGEQSFIKRKKNLEKNEIEITSKLQTELDALFKQKN